VLERLPGAIRGLPARCVRVPADATRVGGSDDAGAEGGAMETFWTLVVFVVVVGLPVFFVWAVVHGMRADREIHPRH
jgi:hypothetical protein